jgi:hypothetical protein
MYKKEAVKIPEVKYGIFHSFFIYSTKFANCKFVPSAHDSRLMTHDFFPSIPNFSNAPGDAQY